MSVVETLPMLYKLNEMAKLQQGKGIIEVHRALLCDSLKKFYPQATNEEIHQELLARGLFDPSESAGLYKTLKRLEAKHVWKTVQNEFEYLKEEWDGPDVPIYIYPLTANRPIVEGVEVKKNGVAYNGVLFLFVADELESEEIKALFAHEYHHICRLAYLNKAPHELELLDALIVEGMAECAVEQRYGTKWLSPWTTRYSQQTSMELWKKYFVRALRAKGVDNHFSFLYGNEAAGLPKWIGYCMGYKIVQSYIENGGVPDQRLLYKTPSKEILKGSIFKV